MELIILAAGRGSRLGNLTNDLPKGLIEINGNSIISRQIQIAKNEIPISKINIAVGYKADKFFGFDDVRKIFVPNWNKFNMIGTFLSVIDSKEIDCTKDILITYGDILIKKGFFSNLELDGNNNITLPIILDWRKQWEGRYENPLSDLETLKYKKNNELIEIGETPKSYDEIMGQFTGVVFVPSSKLDFFVSACREVYYSNLNSDMTFLLSHILKKGNNIKISKVPNGSWYEIDTVKDLKYAKSNYDK